MKKKFVILLHQILSIDSCKILHMCECVPVTLVDVIADVVLCFHLLIDRV